MAENKNIRKINGYFVRDIVSRKASEDAVKEVTDLTEEVDALEDKIDNVLENMELISTSDIEPSDDKVTVWINISEETLTNVIARINDGTVASNTTWSSEKIFEQYNLLLEQYNLLLEQYNLLLERITILEENNKEENNLLFEQYNLLFEQYNLLLERITILEENNKEENTKIALVDEGKVDQCIVD